jgi:hypothetical protein
MVLSAMVRKTAPTDLAAGAAASLVTFLLKVGLEL